MLGIATVLANVDPATACDWAAGFGNPAIRRECLHRTMYAWTRADGDAARRYFQGKSDLEARGILLRSYLLARVRNNTLQPDDLDELTDRFDVAWVASVLEELTIDLADPSINRSAGFDLSAYRAWVNSRSFLTAGQREKVLQALDPTKPAKSSEP